MSFIALYIVILKQSNFTINLGVYSICLSMYMSILCFYNLLPQFDVIRNGHLKNGVQFHF